MRIGEGVKTFDLLTALAFVVPVPYRHVAQDSSPVQSSEEGKVTDGLELLIDTEKDVVVQDEPIVLNFSLEELPATSRRHHRTGLEYLLYRGD